MGSFLSTLYGVVESVGESIFGGATQALNADEGQYSESEPDPEPEPEPGFDLTEGINRNDGVFRLFGTGVPGNITSIPEFVDTYWGDIMAVINRDARDGYFRLRFTVEAYMTNPNGETRYMYFNANGELLDSMTEDDLRDEVLRQLLANLATARMVGSGWTIDRINRFTLRITRYIPIAPGDIIECPKWIMDRKAVVNVRPRSLDDNQCFKWAVVRGLFPSETGHDGRVDDELIRNSETLDWSSIKFPFKPDGCYKAIRGFEESNDVSVSILICNNDKEEVRPFKKGSSNKSRQVCLLLLKEGERYHYTLVKSLSRLLRRQLDVTTKRKIYICTGCFAYYTSEDKLIRHEGYHSRGDEALIRLRKRGEKLKFTNHKMSNAVPLVFYYDFECRTEPSNEGKWAQIHKASGFVILATHDKAKFKPLQYTATDPDENVANTFMMMLDEYVRQCVGTLTKDFSYASEPKDEGEGDLLDEARDCAYCNESLIDKKGKLDRVLSRDPVTKDFVGVDHKRCSKDRCYSSSNIPVVAHNAMAYDVRLLMKEMNKIRGSISCIAKNSNNVKSVTKRMFFDGSPCKLRFTDSKAFALGTLDALAKALITKNPDDSPNYDNFVHTRANLSDVEFSLATRKGVFPYDWFSYLEKLDETSLPSKEEFYSKLRDEGLTDKEYDFVKKVWCDLGFETMRDYHDFYNKVDTLLLADVMTTYRKDSVDVYSLDPFWSISAPGFFWNAFMKMSKVELDYIYEQDVLDIIESSIRGGMVCGMKWYVKANNKYMHDYDPSKPSSFLIYLDINGMYAWAMTQLLPKWGFEIMTEDELGHYWDYPCFIVADWEYPKELHDSHNDLPLAPHRRNGRLMTDFVDRTKHAMHYSEAKQCLELGMKIKRVISGVKFNEETYMKEYVMKNVDLRNEFGDIAYKKALYKLANNAPYGKTVENVRGWVDAILIDNANGDNRYERAVSKPNYKDTIDISESLSFVLSSPDHVDMVKPLYAGAAILGYAKTKLYDFHYKFMKGLYGDNARAVYTDTDSIIYEVKTEDFYEDIKPHLSEWFDTSNYPRDHPLYSDENKGVLGLMKDETAGVPITEFLCVAPKSYLVMCGDKQESKRAKGTPHASQRRRTYEEYKRVVFENEDVIDTVYQIAGDLTKVGLHKSDRVALRNNHAKRHDISNSFGTYAHGHWRIKNEST